MISTNNNTPPTGIIFKLTHLSLRSQPHSYSHYFSDSCFFSHNLGNPLPTLSPSTPPIFILFFSYLLWARGAYVGEKKLDKNPEFV